jgi:hypothetical protein
MYIEIAGPVFKCRDDEAVFFGRLEALAGYESVVWQAPNVLLTLRGEPCQERVEALGEICAFWNLSYKVIES